MKSLAVKREIALRKRVYGRWVVEKRMSEEKAAHEIEAMEGVLATLQSVQQEQGDLGL